MIKVKKSLVPKTAFYMACSAGVDSIATTHLLHRLGYKFKVCHFNHNLREQNNLMEHMVEVFCHDHDLELDVGWMKHEEGIEVDSSEDNLRDHRLAYFKTLNSHIILGHHLNDAVESHIAINLLNGKLNYKPIPEKTDLDDGLKYENYHVANYLLRPFLTTTKDDIISYAENNDLMKYVVEDETNSDNSYRRNWIRNVILPQFEGFGLEKIVLKNFYSSN